MKLRRIFRSSINFVSDVACKRPEGKFDWETIFNIQLKVLSFGSNINNMHIQNTDGRLLPFWRNN